MAMRWCLSQTTGNADHAENEDGSPNTAHSLNPVPIIVVSDRVKSVHNGVLADVAPTVLKLMGLPQPAEMTGKAIGGTVIGVFLLRAGTAQLFPARLFWTCSVCPKVWIV